MLSLHPQIIEKDGRRESVLLPYEEFEALVRAAQDYEAMCGAAGGKTAEAEKLAAEAEAEESEPFLRL